MGRDKSFVEVGGIAMVARVATALSSSGCDPVVTIGGDASGLQRLGLATVPDMFPGEGPLGGVVTALRWCPERPIMVVACDLPLLSGEVLVAMFEAAQEHPDVDVIVAATGRIEPLCAIWRPTAVPVIVARFELGDRAVHRVIGHLHSWVVEVPQLTMTNVNLPADLPADLPDDLPDDLPGVVPRSEPDRDAGG